MRIGILPCVAICVAFNTSCSRQEPDLAESKVESADNIQWIDPNSIQPGPIQHESLSKSQMTRIVNLKKAFSEVDGQSIDQWVDNFKRDLEPDRELAIWERMANTYTNYCSTRELSLDGKKEVYKIVLLRSMAPQKDVLDRLQLTVISKNDAIEIMSAY